MSKESCKDKNVRKGRPRDEKLHQTLLKVTLTELKKTGFRSLTIDQIAAAAEVGKMSVYRRWPNKASLVMEAFMEIIGPQTEFPEAKTILARIRKQVVLQADFFNGPYGEIVRTLIGEAQFNEDLAMAFYEQWLAPRRMMTKEVFELGIQSGELIITDLESATDLLYGPFYYRLVLRSGPIDQKFIREILKAWEKSFVFGSDRNRNKKSSVG